MLFVAQPHLIDPYFKAATTHLMAVVQGIQRDHSGQLLDRLGDPSELYLWTEGSWLRGTFGSWGLVSVRAGSGKLRALSVASRPPRSKRSMHMLREAIRNVIVKRAENQRTHMQGLAGVDRRRTARYTWKEGHHLRPWVVMLVTDAVWTQRKRFLAGFVPSPECPYCRGKEEDLRHLLYECPRWEQIRGALGET